MPFGTSWSQKFELSRAFPAFGVARSRGRCFITLLFRKKRECAARRGRVREKYSALQKQNGVRYGTKLPLNLVFNPVSSKLPGKAK